MLSVMFQSPRNRVNTSKPDLPAAIISLSSSGFNPLEIGSTLQSVGHLKVPQRRESPRFNPLEIGSTLQKPNNGLRRRDEVSDTGFQSPRNRVNTSKSMGICQVEELALALFQSPRNRVNTSKAHCERAWRVRGYAAFQSPRNRVNTSKEEAAKAGNQAAQEGFNPLEIGSTLQKCKPASAATALAPLFQSPRNRVNTSKNDDTAATGIVHRYVSIP